MEKNKKQNKKVQFVVVREFSGDKTMREAFEQLNGTKSGVKQLNHGQGHGIIMVSCPCS